jgi:hypothetical protein
VANAEQVFEDVGAARYALECPAQDAPNRTLEARAPLAEIRPRLGFGSGFAGLGDVGDEVFPARRAENS